MPKPHVRHLDLECLLERLLVPAGGRAYFAAPPEGGPLERRYLDLDSGEDVTTGHRARIRALATAVWIRLGVPVDLSQAERGASRGPAFLRAPLGPASGLDLGDTVLVPQLLADPMFSPAQCAVSRAALYPDLPPCEQTALPVGALSIAAVALRAIATITPSIRLLLAGGDSSAATPLVEAFPDAWTVRWSPGADRTASAEFVPPGCPAQPFENRAVLAGAREVLLIDACAGRGSEGAVLDLARVLGRRLRAVAVLGCRPGFVDPPETWAAAQRVFVGAAGFLEKASAASPSGV